jgi:hypothetical protein
MQKGRVAREANARRLTMLPKLLSSAVMKSGSAISVP